MGEAGGGRGEEGIAPDQDGKRDAAAHSRNAPGMAADLSRATHSQLIQSPGKLDGKPSSLLQEPYSPFKPSGAPAAV